MGEGGSDNHNLLDLGWSSKLILAQVARVSVRDDAAPAHIVFFLPKKCSNLFR
jgi:hypothetical protein